jgi:hypothetical protein
MKKELNQFEILLNNQVIQMNNSVNESDKEPPKEMK